uniref:Anaphase-promoting complex subunit 4 n=1 Tax=Plectus sambesii TaxID=2011161 RepID=A0A914XHA6_9BILA
MIPFLAVGVEKLSWTAAPACEAQTSPPSTSGSTNSLPDSARDSATISLPAFSEEKDRKVALSSSYYEAMAPASLSSVLAVALTDARIELVAAGLLPLLVVDLKSLTGIKSDIRIEDLRYSPTDRQLLVAFVADFPDKGAFVSKVDTSACVALSSPFVSKLTSRYAKLVHTLDYIGQVYEKLRDSWEDLLHEMDVKFVSFAREKLLADGGCVGDDLLVLLLLGTASAEIETFLLHTLGEKGVKKATSFVDTTYRKLLDLLALHLHSAAAALVHHSAELAHDWAELSGTDHDEEMDNCRAMLQAAVELALKGAEMRTVTTLSRRQLTAFFRWLHYALLTVSKEHVPADLSAIDGDFLVQFIRETFMVEYSGETPGRPLFSLEKVGQYLHPGPLAMPLNLERSPWTDLMTSLPVDCVFKCDSAASLADAVTNANRTVNAAVAHMSKSFGECPKLVEFVRVASLGGDAHAKMQFFARTGADESSSSSSLGVCSLIDRSLLTISAITTDGLLTSIQTVDWRSMDLTCCDMDYYKDEQCFLIVRREDDEEYRRVRVDFDRPFSGLSAENSAIVGSGDCDGLYVSGPRCVGMVLSQSRTRVKLFDTEPEDLANRSSLSNEGIISD